MTHQTGRKKRVMIACGSGIATATLVSEHIKDLFKKEGVDAEVVAVGIREIVYEASKADVVVTTAKYKGDPLDKPLLNAISVITMINVEKFDNELLRLIREA